jgi:hypothetical protein
MNKYIVKGNALWREKCIERALSSYQKVLHSQHVEPLEKQIAHYMCAYLNCVLVRHPSLEEAFLGVDLRRPYKDYYLNAGCHIAAIECECFEAEPLGLPVIDQQALAYVDEAYRYYSQIRDVYIKDWHLRFKAYVQPYMSCFIQSTSNWILHERFN